MYEVVFHNTCKKHRDTQSGQRMSLNLVILSAAKDLAWGIERSFAALRMTVLRLGWQRLLRNTLIRSCEQRDNHRFKDHLESAAWKETEDVLSCSDPTRESNSIDC